VPGNASGGMDGIALKSLTVAFHEPGFVSKLNSENQFGPWFTLSDREKQQLGSPMGPANPQALNRYSYTLNNPVRYVDPSGHERYNVDPNDVSAITATFTERINTIRFTIRVVGLVGAGVAALGCLPGAVLAAGCAAGVGAVVLALDRVYERALDGINKELTSAAATAVKTGGSLVVDITENSVIITVRDAHGNIIRQTHFTNVPGTVTSELKKSLAEQGVRPQK
jgi:hypothetical protein